MMEDLIYQAAAVALQKNLLSVLSVFNLDTGTSGTSLYHR